MWVQETAKPQQVPSQHKDPPNPHHSSQGIFYPCFPIPCLPPRGFPSLTAGWGPKTSPNPQAVQKLQLLCCISASLGALLLSTDHSPAQVLETTPCWSTVIENKPETFPGNSEQSPGCRKTPENEDWELLSPLLARGWGQALDGGLKGQPQGDGVSCVVV